MRFGLIGEKLGHSFSKTIHERIAEYTYDLIPLNKDEFQSFMTKKEFTAINVTIPYKKDVIPYIDVLHPHAKAIGAVNTIVQRNEKLYGYNTDFTGFLYMVKKHNIQMANKKVLIIGNGGASAAIYAVAKHEQANTILFVNRHVHKNTILYEECYTHHTDAQIIINTSPVGMYPNIMDTPIELTRFKNCEAVMDVVYNPLLTRLCMDAKKLGIPYVMGLEMLIAQAKQAVEHFLDKSYDDSLIQTIYFDILKKQSNLVLIGMPSAGKTTIANMLAEKLHKEVVDMDEEIIKAYGKDIPTIFEEVQESGFRLLESETALALAKHNQTIISTGGGVIKHESNMEYLHQNGIIIFLDRDIDNLISSDPNRPLSKSKDVIKQMYEERYPLYKKYADCTVMNNGNLEETIEQIEKAYEYALLNKIK